MPKMYEDITPEVHTGIDALLRKMLTQVVGIKSERIVKVELLPVPSMPEKTALSVTCDPDLNEEESAMLRRIMDSMAEMAGGAAPVSLSAVEWEAMRGAKKNTQHS